MKILYAVQKTGNGHLARAQELIPILQQYAQVDVLASGMQSQIDLGIPIKYNCKGLSLYYSKNGGLSFWKMATQNNFLGFVRDIFKIPLKDYDLIINDFEPISAWGARWFSRPLISVSHQAALWFKETPSPKHYDPLLMAVIRYYAPASQYYGFHFKAYHPNIFTPIIRQKIRALTPTVESHYLVYLPAFSDAKIIECLSKVDAQWTVFSKNAPSSYTQANCTFHPINETHFFDALARCQGVLCGAGFELPAESMFLNKKVYVIPIKNQLEQMFNAIGAVEMGGSMNLKLDTESIREWVRSGQSIKADFPDNAQKVIQQILDENRR